MGSLPWKKGATKVDNKKFTFAEIRGGKDNIFSCA